MAIRVFLVDDHTLFRSGVRSLLETLPDIEVAGEAEDGREALSLIGAADPDVVLMDISMPELNGLETTRQLLDDYPEVRVVVLSMHGDPEWVTLALRLGAAGFLLKDATSEELERAVRTVVTGQRFLCSRVTSSVVDEYLRKDAEGTDLLTPRQREIVQLVAEGNTSKEIAGKLRIAVKTVEVHRARVMARLGLTDLAGLVRYAVRNGLVSPDS